MLIENRPGEARLSEPKRHRGRARWQHPPHPSVVFIINPHLRKLNYDPLTSFEPICNLTQSPQVIFVNSGSPYRTMADLTNVALPSPAN